MFNHNIITNIQEQLHVKAAILLGIRYNHQKYLLILACLAVKNSLCWSSGIKKNYNL